MRAAVLLSILSIVVLSAAPALAAKSKTLLPAETATSASSCSGWKAICDSRVPGPGCDARQRECLKTGCWAEGERFGGANHCGLTKK